MELDATLCTPLIPSCSSCPMCAQCNALAEFKKNPSKLVTNYPTKVAKVKQRREFSAISVFSIKVYEFVISIWNHILDSYYRNQKFVCTFCLH